jgi:hypothetical protein
MEDKSSNVGNLTASIVSEGIADDVGKGSGTVCESVIVRVRTVNCGEVDGVDRLGRRTALRRVRELPVPVGEQGLDIAFDCDGMKIVATGEREERPESV